MQDGKLFCNIHLYNVWRLNVQCPAQQNTKNSFWKPIATWSAENSHEFQEKQLHNLYKVKIIHLVFSFDSFFYSTSYDFLHLQLILI